MKLLIGLFIFIFISCQPKIKHADDLIDQMWEVYGGEYWDQTNFEFVFRGKAYSIHRNNGVFNYQSTEKIDSMVIVDELTNVGFYRRLNGIEVDMEPEDRRRAISTLNSVIYFATLPFPLKDPSVKSKLLGREIIQFVNYYVLEITFSSDCDCEDGEDRFLYWIHPETFYFDFMAYRYHTNGGGSRFRVITQRDKLNGLVFQQMDNYSSEHILDSLEIYPTHFVNFKLKKVSEIWLEHIHIHRVE